MHPSGGYPSPREPVRRGPYLASPFGRHPHRASASTGALPRCCHGRKPPPSHGGGCDCIRWLLRTPLTIAPCRKVREACQEIFVLFCRNRYQVVKLVRMRDGRDRILGSGGYPSPPTGSTASYRSFRRAATRLGPWSRGTTGLGTEPHASNDKYEGNPSVISRRSGGRVPAPGPEEGLRGDVAWWESVRYGIRPGGRKKARAGLPAEPKGALARVRSTGGPWPARGGRRGFGRPEKGATGRSFRRRRRRRAAPRHGGLCRAASTDPAAPTGRQRCGGPGYPGRRAPAGAGALALGGLPCTPLACGLARGPFLARRWRAGARYARRRERCRAASSIHSTVGGAYGRNVSSWPSRSL